MTLKKGDIVLLPFPFTDLKNTKIRPALVLWTDSRDVTVCFISSQKIDYLNPEEFIINSSDPEFQKTGLKVKSKVIVSKIVTLEYNLIKRKLGSLGNEYMSKLDNVLKQTFQLSI